MKRYQNKKTSPGPGSYSPTTSESAPQISFPKAKRTSTNQRFASPGPGDYQSMSNYFNGPKYSIPVSKAFKVHLQSPGPGAYEPLQNVSHERFPSFRIGKAKRNLLPCNSEDSPGPGSYSVDLNTMTGPRWRFGSTMRKSEERSPTPGPGQYKMPMTSSGISYTISLSKKGVKRDLTPGPEAYSPKRSENSPSAILGSSSREGKVLFRTPGPGQYQADVERNKQSTMCKDLYRFGSSKRGKSNSFEYPVPGPSDYSIPTHFGRGPRYSIRQRLPKLRQLITPVFFIQGPGAYSSDSKLSTEEGPKWTIPSTGRDAEPVLSPQPY